MRLLGLVAALALVVAGASISTGCAGPYAGKPEALKKPRTKKKPKDAKTATEVAEPSGPPAMSDEPCRANFFGEPSKKRRMSREARTMASEAEAVLVNAERNPAERRSLALEAMAILENALSKDPYGPEPTYKLAVAYALVGKKACSLALLERLKALQGMPEVEAEAARTAQRAARDPAFEPFRNDAKRAVGQ